MCKIKQKQTNSLKVTYTQTTTTKDTYICSIDTTKLATLPLTAKQETYEQEQTCARDKKTKSEIQDGDRCLHLT